MGIWGCNCCLELQQPGRKEVVGINPPLKQLPAHGGVASPKSPFGANPRRPDGSTRFEGFGFKLALPTPSQDESTSCTNEHQAEEPQTESVPAFTGDFDGWREQGGESSIAHLREHCASSCLEAFELLRSGDRVVDLPGFRRVVVDEIGFNDLDDTIVLFRWLDSDNDGLVSVFDLVTRILGTEETTAELFKRVIQKCKGKQCFFKKQLAADMRIDMDQFRKVLDTELQPEDIELEATLIFRLLDRDQLGSISLNEVKALLWVAHRAIHVFTMSTSDAKLSKHDLRKKRSRMLQDGVDISSESAPASYDHNPRNLQRKSTRALEAYLREEQLVPLKRQGPFGRFMSKVAAAFQVVSGRDRSRGELRPSVNNVLPAKISLLEHSQQLEQVTTPLTNRKSSLTSQTSVHRFSECTQTIIIFDWDDTLFPTTYLLDELALDHDKPIRAQTKLTSQEKARVSEELLLLESCVDTLLKLSLSKGRVVLVTLAKKPWVTQMCRWFYPRISSLITANDIQIIYAQEGEQIDYNKKAMMDGDEIELFYASMKGRAIKKAVETFYSSYAGQSWKNIISIGDSDFERLGTIMMAESYLRQLGSDGRSDTVEVNGRVFKVRTKTFKMLDEPSLIELISQVQLLDQWLPNMVTLDDGFDIDLTSVEDPEALREITLLLQGH